MVTIEGMVTVAEAARRLKLSPEQVRRRLREGALRGQRIGNQWFVEEQAINTYVRQPLVSPELLDDIRRLREEIRARVGHDFDVVAMVREERESH